MDSLHEDFITLGQRIEQGLREKSYRDLPPLWQALLNDDSGQILTSVLQRSKSLIPFNLWVMLINKNPHIISKYSDIDPPFDLKWLALSLDKRVICHFKEPTVDECSFACANNPENIKLIYEPKSEFIWHMLKLDVKNRKYFDTSLLTSEMKSYINNRIITNNGIKTMQRTPDLNINSGKNPNIMYGEYNWFDPEH